MSFPIVSIVLPCYNGESQLYDSIQSCIDQTFTNWELIIVNDGSIDNSQAIAQKFAEKDNRIKVISNEKNIKLPASLNKGFGIATGKYLTWTSHDNKMHLDMLAELVAYLDNNSDIGLVTADYAAIDDDDNQLYTVNMPDPMFYLPLYNTICYAFMYRREVLDIIGGYADDLFLIEDYDYWIRIWQKFKIGKINKVLYYTRVNNSTLTATRKKDIAQRLLDVRLKYFDDFDRFLKSHPKLRRKFLISIVDNMNGVRRLEYSIYFCFKSPFIYAPYYLFWYRPKQIAKKFSFYKKIRSHLKQCQK